MEEKEIMAEIAEYIFELTEFDEQKRILEALTVLETAEDKRSKVAKKSLKHDWSSTNLTKSFMHVG